jgi:hypothetical protein
MLTENNDHVDKILSHLGGSGKPVAREARRRKVTLRRENFLREFGTRNRGEHFQWPAAVSLCLGVSTNERHDIIKIHRRNKGFVQVKSLQSRLRYSHQIRCTHAGVTVTLRPSARP